MPTDKVAIPYLSMEQFQHVDMRVGTIVCAERFPEARKPAYKLLIDFGPEIGTKRSSAQITDHYLCEQLIGRQVLAVVNLAPRKIGPVQSEVLVLGVNSPTGGIHLIQPDHKVLDGERVH